LNFGVSPDFSVQLKVSLSESLSKRLSQKLKRPTVIYRVTYLLTWQRPKAWWPRSNATALAGYAMTTTKGQWLLAIWDETTTSKTMSHLSQSS